jgi:hypothetical protein
LRDPRAVTVRCVPAAIRYIARFLDKGPIRIDFT